MHIDGVQRSPSASTVSVTGLETDCFYCLCVRFAPSYCVLLLTVSVSEPETLYLTVSVDLRAARSATVSPISRSAAPVMTLTGWPDENPTDAEARTAVERAIAAHGATEDETTAIDIELCLPHGTQWRRCHSVFRIFVAASPGRGSRVLSSLNGQELAMRP